MSQTHKEAFEAQKLRKRLRRQVGQAIADYQMIRAGDKVMVCLSGGKDSYTMLDILLDLQRRAPVSFELIAVHLDQKQPDYDATVLPRYLASTGVPFTILEQDTYSVVKRVVPEGKTMCGLCSRLRRGALYTFAAENGVSKIALGHHRDDMVETLFLNLFYGARLASMPPKLRSDDGRNVLIRPLAYCAEADIAQFAQLQAYPIIPCNLCGSQDGMQRQVVKDMLQDWERRFPGRVETIFRSMGSVRASQLCDRDLFDFAALDGAAQGALSAHDWLAGTESAGRPPVAHTQRDGTDILLA